MEKIEIDIRIYNLLKRDIKTLKKKLETIDKFKVGDKVEVIAGYNCYDYLEITEILDNYGKVKGKSEFLNGKIIEVLLLDVIVLEE
jgi:hypothetical protein